MKALRTAVGLSWRRVNRGRHTILEVAGVAGIAAAGGSLHEGWALLVLGAYAVIAANMNGGRR